MANPISFTFGIGLIAKRRARDWELVQSLLRLTLASVLAQTDQDYRVVIAGHDRPRAMPDDARFRFLPVDWPADRPDEHNSDGGMKKYRIGEDLLERGGGLLMLLDADDWVDRRLVELARTRIGQSHVGGIIEDGYATDMQTLKALRLPDRRAFDIGFQRICGSSVIGRLDPEAADPLRRDPCHNLGSHHQWPEASKAKGVPLARLPVVGNYLINTSENHSESHGPHDHWRRELVARVQALGSPLDDDRLAPFGLTLADIEPLSRRVRRRPACLRQA
jgi:hypothetical protein